jgi:hypothetical protein
VLNLWQTGGEGWAGWSGCCPSRNVTHRQGRSAKDPQGRGPVGEVAIGWDRHGSSSAGLLENYAARSPPAWATGVPLADLLRPGLGLRFPPHGRTDALEILQPPPSTTAADAWLSTSCHARSAPRSESPPRPGTPDKRRGPQPRRADRKNSAKGNSAVPAIAARHVPNGQAPGTVSEPGSF